MGVDLELVHRLLEAWNRRDMETLAGVLTSDFRWIDHEESPDDAGKTKTGIAAIEAMTSDLDESFEAYSVDVVDIVEVDDQQVILVLRETATGSTSGAHLTSDFGYRMLMRGDRFSKIEVYRDPADAFAAAGLPAN